MNKKVLALVVASVCAAPAFAQTSNVTLYGRANVGVDQYQANGSASGDVKSRMRVFDSSSRLGVRGTEDLGNGLRAVFQIESGLRIDTGAALNSANAADSSAGTLASRPSFAGIEGGFGRILWGRQDVYWGNGTIAQTAANYINTEVPWLTGNNVGLVNVGVSRQSNVMTYTTPQLGPVNVTLSWSPDTSAGGSTTATTSAVNNEIAPVGVDPKAKLMGATGRFAMGALAAQIDYVQKSTNWNSTGNLASKPTNTGLKMGVGFRYAPGAQISLIVTQAKTENVAGTASADYKQTSWGLNWEHIFGNVQMLAQYGQMGKVSGEGCTGTTCDETKATGWMVGARYLMSKRTALYAMATQVTNQRNQFADYTGGGYTPVAMSSTKGGDPRVIGVGLIHNF